MSSALIIGRAKQVWYDVESAINSYNFDYVIGVNRAGADYSGTLEHWVSYHAELFPTWIEMRKKNGFEPAGQLWTTGVGRKRNPFDDQLGLKYIDCLGGSSGRIAVAVARSIGCDRIVLAGVPLDSEAGHYDQEGDWEKREVDFHRDVWERDLVVLKPYVRSMSGWTQDLLGEPTQEWLTSGTPSS